MRGSGATASADLHAALASPVRRQLLKTLRSAASALDAHELAEQVGLHLTTVRSHLEVLRGAGLLERRSQASVGAGRPRTVYAPVHKVKANGDAGYQGLTRLLAAHLSNASEERAARAERTGIAWAEELLCAPQATHRTVDDAAEQVNALFAEMGFEPELITIGQERHIAFHACPFGLVAREHPEVICSMHLGLLRGSLNRLRVAADSQLLPFVEPELCIAQLAPVG